MCTYKSVLLFVFMLLQDGLVLLSPRDRVIDVIDWKEPQFIVTIAYI